MSDFPITTWAGAERKTPLLLIILTSVPVTVSAETTVSTLAPGGLNSGGRWERQCRCTCQTQRRGVLPGSGHSCLGGLHVVGAIPVKVSPHSCAVTGVLVEGTSGDL